MIKEILTKLVMREDLSSFEMERILEEIIKGEVKEAQIGGLLSLLRAKGETKEEIEAAVKVLRKHATKIRLPEGAEGLDIVGTGGDGKNTFNISTLSALVIATGGVRVAKHGNVGVSSRCGSADVLNELGVKIRAEKEVLERCLKEVNIGFLFAQTLHKAMKEVTIARKNLGISTIFNYIGPLTNPAGVKRYIVGVSKDDLLSKFSHVLKDLGTDRGLVIHGQDGLDEITTCTKTKGYEIEGGKLKDFLLDPKDYSIKYTNIEELLGGDTKENAKIVWEVLNGEGTRAQKDVVALNAGFGFYIGGICKDAGEGIDKAYKILKSKSGIKTLKGLIEVSNMSR